MKRVLITGGAGFIAHHLIYYILKTTNWEIVSCNNFENSAPDHCVIINNSPKIRCELEMTMLMWKNNFRLSYKTKEP